MEAAKAAGTTKIPEPTTELTILAARPHEVTARIRPWSRWFWCMQSIHTGERIPDSSLSRDLHVLVKDTDTNLRLQTAAGDVTSVTRTRPKRPVRYGPIVARAFPESAHVAERRKDLLRAETSTGRECHNCSVENPISVSRTCVFAEKCYSD